MSVEKQRIGVAVVGLGVGEQHARAYSALDGCELRWLYDLDSGRARDLARQLGALAVASSFEEILKDGDVHVLSIASYDDAHFQQVVAALDASKHVFVEKPLCRTVEELRVIKQAWSKHGGKLKLSSNLVLRAAPVYQWLRQKVRAGDFGDIYAFDGDYLYGRLNKITEGWRKGVGEYSVMLGGGIHLIDMMLWLLSERPRTVQALGNRISTKNTSFGYNDFVAASFQYSSGLVGRITANFGCVHRHQHAMRIFGTRETFLYDDAGPRLHASRDPGAEASPVTLATLPRTKGELISSFVRAVLEDEDWDAHTQEIFDVISICAASDKSLQSNSSVEIQYV